MCQYLPCHVCCVCHAAGTPQGGASPASVDMIMALGFKCEQVQREKTVTTAKAGGRLIVVDV